MAIEIRESDDSGQIFAVYMKDEEVLEWTTYPVN